jgi:hypothetical protein
VEKRRLERPRYNFETGLKEKGWKLRIETCVRLL